MILYHWTLNIKKLQKNWFQNHHSIHKDEMDGVWFTDQLMGGPTTIRSGMWLVTVDIPGEEIDPYEEQNKGSGYRALNIPVNILNQYPLESPIVYSDRGVYKEINWNVDFC